MRGSTDARLLDVTALRYADQARGVLLAGSGILAGTPRLLRSLDGGRSWIEALAPRALDGEVAPFDLNGRGRQLYFAGLKHVYRSSDGGLTWARVRGSGLSGTDITRLAAGPGGTLLLAKRGALFRSNDAGQSWTAL